LSGVGAGFVESALPLGRTDGLLGRRVRAGVRDTEKAQGFLQTAKEYGIISPDAAKRLTLVPVDLTDIDTIAPAIGNAGKVIDVFGNAPQNV